MRVDEGAQARSRIEAQHCRQGSLERSVGSNIFESPNDGLVCKPDTPRAAARSAVILRIDTSKVQHVFLYRFVRSPRRHRRSWGIQQLLVVLAGRSGKGVSSCIVAVALMSWFFGSEDTAAPSGGNNAARSDRRWPIPRVSFHSVRATLIGSMPACFHQARSSRERCTAR